MNQSATLKLFLPFGDPKRLRTAEISNWSGKAIAGPRSDLEQLLSREELTKPGIYFLLGVDPTDGKETAYIGEAETVSDRIKQHRSKDYWNSVIAFVSKDENLTKAHIRYLEGRLIILAESICRYKLLNSAYSGARLPEADIHEMEVFLERVLQLMPVLGSEILTPVAPANEQGKPAPILYCAMKGAAATGRPTPNGFVVLKGSTAVLEERASAATHGKWINLLRKELLESGALVQQQELLIFTRDTEFSSPSAAAGVVHGGTAAGPLAWKDQNGKTLKTIEEES